MTKVKLRTKPISGGRQALYLDFYPPIIHPETGKQTRREHLNLFIFSDTEMNEERYINKNGNQVIKFTPALDRNGKEKRAKLNEFEKEHNKETKALAESIRAKRQIEIQNGNYGFLPSTKKDADFIEFFEGLVSKKAGSTAAAWNAVLIYLKKYTGGSLRFTNLTERFCIEFREYLLTAPSLRSKHKALTPNTTNSYFSKFKSAIRQAYEDGFLQADLNGKVKGTKRVEVEKNYLTFEELQTLVKTDCSIPLLKRAAIFSALTGLRFSDIQKLIWAEVRKDGDNYSLNFMQQKTKGLEVLPISEQAFSLLGERKDPTRQVFEGLEYSGHLNIQLKLWVLKAGITKNITFHSFRHTYATLQLSLGTDIYTVSKMLGHREIKTTQIYAKIVDKQKQEAANKIKLDL
jgi:integrase